MRQALPGGQQANVQRELVALLGKGVTRLRKTDETPACISAIDVAVAISGLNKKHAGLPQGQCAKTGLIKKLDSHHPPPSPSAAPRTRQQRRP